MLKYKKKIQLIVKVKNAKSEAAPSAMVRHGCDSKIQLIGCP